MTFRACLLGVLAWALIAPGPAAAGQMFDLGQGTYPSLAVDSAGVGHVAFLQHDAAANTDVVKYCQLAQGKAGCLNPLTLTAPPAPSAISGPLLALGPSNTVYVLAGDYPYQKVYLWTSTTGGAGFTGPTVVSTAAPGTNPGNALVGPSGALFMATWNPSSYFQSLAPGATATSKADLGGHFVYDIEVGLSGATPVLAGWRIPGGGAPTEFGFWRWSGAGDPNDPATWIGPAAIGDGSNTHLASGPRGLFLISHEYRPGVGFPDSYAVQRFDGTTFTAPVTVVAQGVAADENALFEDPTATGALHVVWREGSTPYSLWMASSSDGGATFGGPIKIVNDPNLMIRPHGATGGDGRGFVVWDHNTPDGQVSAATLDELPAPPPVAGKSVQIGVVSGDVFVKLPPGAPAPVSGRAHSAQAPPGFVPLKGEVNVPIGSTVDTTKGVIEMASAANRSGATQEANFYAGVFQVKQRLTKAKKLTTDLVVKGASASTCKARAARRKPSKKVLGQLWGDGKGSYKTVGRHSAATVRGTKWLTQERCDGTFTRVVRGVVSVRDLGTHRTVKVRAGHSYLARAQRLSAKSH